ncbi:NYN domain-containing protein [Alkalicoccobacillus plakortidis]|uniref:NYN domain-containing protein n=1 Tax=Alkalicoccobacillus plakortidis TaxID=444060 RepID=A0ABT0XIL6_9BACI|nr:NYN domain-containing protein [Alkalicoccobacillus plakortidis]MCM2675755.1 NYN domain-containing protein [Alkalicoccobacillus plakortidis]
MEMKDQINDQFIKKLDALLHSNYDANLPDDNVAIFVDYDNVYWTLMNRYNHNPNHEEKSKNLFQCLWERYGQDRVRTFRAYADFQRIRSSLTDLQKQRIQIKHVYSNDKDGDSRKNSSDIELCIDAIESTFKDESISCYVFVTADSDMVPIMSRLMYKGKQVHLFYLSEAAPKHTDITNYSHHSEDLGNFLKLEEQEYELDAYVEQSLQFIDEWEKKYGDSDLYLGAPWLRNQYSLKFSIPANSASELIDLLKVRKLIGTINKDLSTGEVKPSLALTEKGRNTVTPFVESVSVRK